MSLECQISSDGTKYWFLDRRLHRDDGPAIERPGGTKHWYLNGKCHREDGPAIEEPDGSQEWYLDGKLHREDGPAIIRPDGYKEWYIHGNWIIRLSDDLKEKYPKIYDQLLVYQIMEL